MSSKGMQIRGGTRGGKDQFDWEDVKVDKDRENYLGHSLKASVGRWQKGRDLTWYTKKSKVTGYADQLNTEIVAIKRAEEEAMAAALGLKPPAPVKPQQALTRQEMAEACRRRSQDEVMEDGEERIKGIGYQSQRTQAMFMSTKNTTTKEGATIFEHDSLVKDDGRLKMPEAKRRSTSDLTSPTTITPMAPVAITTPLPASSVAVTQGLPSIPDSTKRHKKRKKVKRMKEEKCHTGRGNSSDSSMSGPDLWVERTTGKHRHSRELEDQSRPRKKKKRQDKEPQSSSSEDKWTEKRDKTRHKIKDRSKVKHEREHARHRGQRSDTHKHSESRHDRRERDTNRR